MATPFVVPVTGLLTNDFIDPWITAFAISSVGMPATEPGFRSFHREVSGREQEAIATKNRTAIKRDLISKDANPATKNQKMKIAGLNRPPSPLTDPIDGKKIEIYSITNFGLRSIP